jgi:hypothetical protein
LCDVRQHLAHVHATPSTLAGRREAGNARLDLALPLRIHNDREDFR